MSKKMKQKKGFTIIEVVLVLAIAGLIFLMVFYVVPQAMAGQRDGERRQAMSRVQSALVQYQTNNKTKRNNLPNNNGAGDKYAFTETADKGGFSDNCDKNIACSFIKNYMNTSENVASNVNMFLDPDGVPYNIVITNNWALASGSAGLSPTYANDEAKSHLASVGTGAYTIQGTDPLSK